MYDYDVIIVGAGPAGIFAALELNKQAPDLKVSACYRQAGEHSGKCLYRKDRGHQFPQIWCAYFPHEQ